MAAASPSSVGPPADGFVVFAKEECPTCQLVAPVLRTLARTEQKLVVYSQDDPAFPADLDVVDDTALEQSFRLDVETVPTLIRLSEGREVARTVGWDRAEWERVTGLRGLGEGLPGFQPGCGSKSRDPGVYEHLLARFGNPGLGARKVTLGDWDDEAEACFDRGWTDGLPVVAPTDARILRMLAGTSRKPDEIVGLIPPNLAPCTVEKVAINAVMAGCKPEYMPVVLAALEAALEPVFTMHGLLCTTCFSGPVIVVNGPITRAIGMNWGINALGQGNRANMTIGRALQLVIRNVGGGRPGEIDRATIGWPGKISCCFAEDETDPAWQPLSVARGIAPGRSAVTLFQGYGVQACMDQRSRTPEELTRSLALSLGAVCHPKVYDVGIAMLVLSPEHYAIFRSAGWDRARLEDELLAAAVRPGKELVAGAQGIGEGISAARADEMVPKFRRGGLLIVRAGGPAGLWSGILAGWPGTRVHDQTRPVTREIKP
jgi:hypothetical protein